MRKLFSLGLCTVLGALSIGSAAAQSELTMSSWLPPTHTLNVNFLTPWAEAVEAETEGRVKVRLLTKPVTNPQGHFDAVRNGLADVAFISHAYYPGRFELANFSVFPFSGDTAEARSVAAWTLYDKYMMPADEHRGVKLLTLYTHGPGIAFTKDKKIENIDDFDGLKVRVGGGMAADLAKSVGATVVAKPAPESYELLSTGVVDGVFFPAGSVLAFKLDGIIQYATTFPGGLYSDSHAFIMNQDAFDRLDPQDQEVIERLSGEYAARLAGQAWDKEDEVAQALFGDSIEVIEADEALVAAVTEKTQHIRDRWAQAAADAGLDPDAVLVEFAEEIEKNSN